MIQEITCRMMAESDIDLVVPLYIEHYNTYEGGEWTQKTTYKRIHQVWSREDSLCMILEQSNEVIGFVIRTGVISNITYCGEVVEERINNLLPEHSFEFIIATSEYMFRKPNKRIFELALEKAGLQPEDVWYIGDNYLCDVVGARNAGIFPVWYIGATTDPQGEDDVLTISHWEQLEQAISELGE